MRTLPPEAFVDPDHHRREMSAIFERSWLFVPQRPALDLRDDPRSLAALVARRGSRAPVSVLDRPLFLQRDWDGALHAFPNVCTHAWHTLVQGPDRQRAITCPQHGRQFDCAGRFASHAGIEKGEPSDDLRDLPVAEWGEMLFVAMRPPEASLDEVLAPVRESLGSLPLERLERRPASGEVRELEGNWKLHAWNYLDSSHIPHIHRKPGGLADALHMDSYRTEVHDRSVLQWAYAKEPALGFDPALLPERFRDARGRRVFALWWYVWPNLTLNFYPWGLSVNLYSPVPDKPRRTLFHWYHYAWDEEKYARREEAWLMREVDAEDVDALSQVSRGVASGLAVAGRFARGEDGPAWLHRKVGEAVGR